MNNSPNKYTSREVDDITALKFHTGFGLAKNARARPGRAFDGSHAIRQVLEGERGHKRGICL